MQTDYNTIFISDVHLGTSYCQAEALLNMLTTVTTKKIVLIGDIIDLHALKRRMFLPHSHIEVIRRVLKLANTIEVVYVPGNHDDYLRAYHKEILGNIIFINKHFHTTENGDVYVVKHGDEFDGVIRNMTWLYDFGDFAYELALKLNKPFNKFRRAIGYHSDFSLSMYWKGKVKNAIKVINNYKQLISTKAKQYSVQGVICGHIHEAGLSTINGITYANCGCWTEYCSFIAEKKDGNLELVYWENKVLDKK